MTGSDKPIIRMTGIIKDFPGTRALDQVNFDVREGEVHALVGENGAGKSTLMNILSGGFSDYQGRVELFGKRIDITNPRRACEIGIGTIFQEVNVLSERTVAENIMLGHEPTGRIPGLLNAQALREEARGVLDYLNFDLPLEAPVGQLSIAQQQLVEIAHAIRKDVKLLILDEPTASLGVEEVEKLFQVIRDLKSRGLGMVYISHRLAELPRIADRVTVLRDGRVVDTYPMEEVKVSEITRMMLGRELSEAFPEKRNRTGEVIFSVRNLSRSGYFRDISFDVRAGEILGLAGLVGSGRTELVRAVFGADKSQGICNIKGKEIKRRIPSHSVRYGLGMIPENRQIEGIITGRPVAENLVISVFKRLSSKIGFVGPEKVKGEAYQMIRRMNIIPPDISRSIKELSGGNQQKVVVGRWLAADCKVIIFDEPTRGIDVGTKAQMYKLIMDLACEGRAIILISSEFIEVVELADRILVMQEGRIIKELSGSETDEETLMQFCSERETE